MKRRDLTGQRFGKLIALEAKGPNKWQNLMWECICDCGNKAIVVGGHLVRGGTTSCGCNSSRHRISDLNKTHGLSGKRFYNIFMTMKARCENPKAQKWHRYGGRGIKNTWKSFEDFKEDMYQSYLLHSEEHGEKQTTIDRINNDGNYSKANCRWANFKVQARNNTGLFKKGLTPWNKKI